MGYREQLRRLHWILSAQFGWDPLRTLWALFRLPGFIRDYWDFRRRYAGALSIFPCLHDRTEEAGELSEYFWQDLYVAQKVFEQMPQRHVDIGSRIDGFVAHVASFREVEVFDIRPINRSILRVCYRQVDLMALPKELQNYADSVSCLHVLEHIGLSRYGDRVDPDGYKKALRNLSWIVEPGGRLYLSTPCGRERVEFNGHRVFNPMTLLRLAEAEGLALEDAAVISAGGVVEADAKRLTEVAHKEYKLVLFTLKRTCKAGGDAVPQQE